MPTSSAPPSPRTPSTSGPASTCHLTPLRTSTWMAAGPWIGGSSTRVTCRPAGRGGTTRPSTGPRTGPPSRRRAASRGGASEDLGGHPRHVLDRHVTYVVGQTPAVAERVVELPFAIAPDRKSTRLNSSHLGISYAVF